MEKKKIHKNFILHIFQLGCICKNISYNMHAYIRKTGLRLDLHITVIYNVHTDNVSTATHIYIIILISGIGISLLFCCYCCCLR